MSAKNSTSYSSTSRSSSSSSAAISVPSGGGVHNSATAPINPPSCSSSSSPQASAAASAMIVHVPPVPVTGRPLQIPRTMPRGDNPSGMLTSGQICSSFPSTATTFIHRPIMPLLLMSMVVLLLQAVHAAPPNAGGRTLHVPYGAVLTLDVGDDRAQSPTGFPGWARLNDSSDKMYGIPQANDVGEYTIPLKERTVRIDVGSELKQRCEEGSPTTWLEIVDPRRLTDLSMENQYNSVKQLLDTLNVQLQDVRLFTFDYLDKYRTVTKTDHKLEQNALGEQLVFTVNISCGVLTDQAIDVINAAAENGLVFQVVQGFLAITADNVRQTETTSLPNNQLVTDDDQTTKTTNATNSQSPSGNASSTFSAVPLIILTLILAILMLTGIFWTLIRRAKSGKEKHQADTNGKAQGGAAHLSSPAGDSTTPMLGHRGNGDRTDGMAPENGGVTTTT
ncbi:hypothetical protein GPALN_002992 [Globodera pallida]|nr:hypothetical protein GPALN_002992 [Globodera pallida]